MIFGKREKNQSRKNKQRHPKRYHDREKRINRPLGRKARTHPAPLPLDKGGGYCEKYVLKKLWAITP